MLRKKLSCVAAFATAAVLAAVERAPAQQPRGGGGGVYIGGHAGGNNRGGSPGTYIGGYPMAPTQGSGTYIGGYPAVSPGGYSGEPRLFTNPGYKGYTTPLPPRIEDYYPHPDPRLRRKLSPSDQSPDLVSRPPVQGEKPATIWLNVPPEAEIWVDGERTFQRGRLREFESPPLAPGKDYVYRLRARWTENGRLVDQTREVVVRSGKYMRVEFAEAK